MIKRKFGWTGNYRWGRAGSWDNAAWNFHNISGFSGLVNTIKLSFLANTAFFEVPGVDLSGFAGVEGTSTPWKIIVYDRPGRTAIGYIGAVGGGETPGGELVTNGNCSVDSFTEGTGWTYDGTADEYDCDGSQTAATGLTQNINLVNGTVYKVLHTIKNFAAGTAAIRINSTDTTAYLTGDGVRTNYLTNTTATASRTMAVRGDADFIGSVDDISVTPLSDCAATGVHIVSAKNGATHAWTSIDASFSHNLQFRARIEVVRA